MQVSVETTEALECKLTITVPSDRVDTLVNEKLRQTAKNVHLKGFRQGKVPLKLVKNRFGKGVRQEVVNDLMKKSCLAAINDEHLRPVDWPTLDPVRTEEGQDLEFIARFEVYPEIELPDFSTISVSRLTAEVTGQDIDEMVEILRRQRRTWKVVERAAAEGDNVTIDYVGKQAGQELPDGKVEKQSLILGSKRLIPGLEEGVIGRQAGDHFSLNLCLPTDYQTAELAGAEVEYDITLHSVRESVLPEVDAAFFSSFGVDEGGEEAFRTEVASHMQREMQAVSRARLKAAVTDALLDKLDMALPAGLITDEIQQIRQEIMQQWEEGKEEQEQQEQQEEQREESLDELLVEHARQRVVKRLVWHEIIMQEDIILDADKLRQAVEEAAATYESPEEVVQWYYADEERLEVIKNNVIEEQVFDLILESAEVAEKQVPYRQVVRPEFYASSGSGAADSADD